MSEPLWQPSENRVADANLTRFIAAVADDWGFRAEDFDALHRWSVAEKEKFWQAACAGAPAVSAKAHIAAKRKSRVIGLVALLKERLRGSLR